MNACRDPDAKWAISLGCASTCPSLPSEREGSKLAASVSGRPRNSLRGGGTACGGFLEPVTLLSLILLLQTITEHILNPVRYHSFCLTWFISISWQVSLGAAVQTVVCWPMFKKKKCSAVSVIYEIMVVMFLWCIIAVQIDHFIMTAKREFPYKICGGLLKNISFL